MTQKDDILKELFGQIPEEPLPVSFRTDVMRRIAAETERIRRRNERLGWIALIAASLAMLALAAGTLFYVGIPKISVSLPKMDIDPFYLSIGLMALLLLGMDHLLRRRIGKRQEKRL